MPNSYSYPDHGPVQSRHSLRRRLTDLFRALPVNVRWGLGWGIALATGLSLWVALLSLSRGSIRWPDFGMTTWSIIGGYYAAALLAGPVVGLLRPLTRWRLGTFFIGWVAGTIVYAVVGLAMPTAREVPWWLAAVPGLAMGGLALVFQDDERFRGHAKSNPRFIAAVLGLGALLALLMLAAGWW